MNPLHSQVASTFSVEESSSSASSNSTTAAGSSTQKRKAGRKKFKETRHPVYKGVRQRNGKWVSEVRQPNKKNRVWLGTYPCPTMAARAYDAAALAIRGESASLNFPQSASQLPRAASSSVRDIQSVALQAAQAFETTKEETEREDSDSELCRGLFFDEEAAFNMPTLLDSMAEALIITPPAMKKGFDWDDVENEQDLTLWTDSRGCPVGLG